MKTEIAIIGSQTLGTLTEMHEALSGNNKVVLIENELTTKKFVIENTYFHPEIFIKPLTRKERRNLKHKNGR